MRRLPLKLNLLVTSYLLLVTVLCGCATYKFQRGQKPYDKGYVASRNNYTILEYTLGKDNSVPDSIKLAKGRFKRRRNMVEHYYKKMGYIENHFKMTLWDPPIIFLKSITGVFRLPFIAISDYRYEHNPKYKEKIRKIEEGKDIREEARLQRLKDELKNYLQKDLAAEPPSISEVSLEKSEQIGQKIPETKTQTPEMLLVEKKAKKPALKKVKPRKEKRVKPLVPKVNQQELPQQPKAVIIAKPTKGFSPLAVHFYGHKSYSPQGEIISYAWDFGDGDTSTKINSINTYYSGSFEPRQFIVTLTVKDSQGNAATASTIIEVLNK